jgi:hypothetical protein
MKFLLSVVQNLIFFIFSSQSYVFFNILSLENLIAVRIYDYLFDLLANIQSTLMFYNFKSENFQHNC